MKVKFFYLKFIYYACCSTTTNPAATSINHYLFMNHSLIIITDKISQKSVRRFLGFFFLASWSSDKTAFDERLVHWLNRCWVLKPDWEKWPLSESLLVSKPSQRREISHQLVKTFPRQLGITNHEISHGRFNLKYLEVVRNVHELYSPVE